MEASFFNAAAYGSWITLLILVVLQAQPTYRVTLMNFVGPWARTLIILLLFASPTNMVVAGALMGSLITVGVVYWIIMGHLTF